MLELKRQIEEERMLKEMEIKQMREDGERKEIEREIAEE